MGIDLEFNPKKRKYMRILFFLLSFFISFGASAAILDGVVAVVDKEIILFSELNEITRLALATDKQSVTEADTALFREMRKKVLGRILDDRVLLARARQESLVVSDDEVKEMLDRQIEALSRQYGSLSALDAELQQKYDLSVVKLKRQYKKDIQENLLKQRFQEKYFRQTSVNREEVNQFYSTYKDSLPAKKEAMSLSHIALSAKSSSEKEKEARHKIAAAQARINAGESFEAVAAAVSEDPSAKDSGDIGTFTRGSLGLPEFEQAVFELKIGEISQPIQTRLGFHLIKVLERSDRQAHVRHILALLKPSEEAVKTILATLDSIQKTVKDSAGFAASAIQYSEDDASKSRGGYLGWYTPDQLPQDFADSLLLLGAGQISNPMRAGDVFHLFRMNSRSENRPLSVEEDYENIRNMAQTYKVKKELENKIRVWRGDYYIQNYLAQFDP
jgi:peptidyl-prolyl cis-trans isomerase SurA